jgi:hypothetical protein
MKSKFVRILTLITFLMFLAPGRLWSQGLFQGLGLPRTVTATGHTEVVGSILVSLREGTTQAGILLIDLSPLRITNTLATDISVVPTGNLAAGAVTIDAEKGLVRIPVFAGGTAGIIRIDGVRVSVPGTGITSMNAKLSWENSLNLLTSGTSVTVIDSVQSGLAADPITDRFVIFNGQVLDNTSTISLREGYPAAFSSSTGYGQTVPTRIRIRVTDFPANLQMIFPASVTAKNSTSTLTTLEGSAVTLPRLSGSNDVTYNFSGVSESNGLIESFDIPFTVVLSGPPEIIQPTIEVGLAPIGAAVPDSVLPSTDVPRYALENIAVQEGSSRIITKILYWTGINSSLQNQVNLFNPSSRTANLTIDALNSAGLAVSGSGITNPAKVSVPASQALVRTVSELFGTSTGISSIRIQTTGSELLATAVVSGSGTTESVSFVSRAISGAFVPVVNEGAQLRLLNPNSSPTSGTLTLRTAEGRFVTSSSIQIAPLASASVPIGTTFNNPSTGYVFGSFSNPVVAFESFGEGNPLNMLAIQPPASVSSLFIPFFADGNGFQTDVNLLNESDDTVPLKAQQFNGTGAPVGPIVLITMPPSEQLAVNVDRIFSQVASTGYIRFEVPQLFKGFFPYFPTISGHARVRSSQGGSTVIPISAYPLQDAFILGSGTGASEFQGLALVNPTASAVTVTLQAISSVGTVLGDSSASLSPGQVLTRLVTEFFTGGLPAQSVIRVTASAPIVTTSITGSLSLDALRSLPVLR